MFETYTTRTQSDNKIFNENPDFHTFKGIGIRVNTYPEVLIANETSGKAKADFLLLRTSQINQNPVLGNFDKPEHTNIIILCDETWQTSDFLCTSSNFISQNPEQNILIQEEEKLSIGYIEKSDGRYFLFPELFITNILMYPNLLNLTSSISNSQNIENAVISNNIELGKQNGISFFPGAALALLTLYLLTIYLLNLVNNKINIKVETVRIIIPLITLVPFALLFFYTTDSLALLKHGTELSLERITGIDPDLMPNSIWIFVPMLLILIGFEFNIFILKYKDPLLRYTYNHSNPFLIKSAVILVLSHSLLLLAWNQGTAKLQPFLNSLFFAMFLFILYSRNPFKQKIPMIFIGKYRQSTNLKYLLRAAFLCTVAILSAFGYYFDHSKTESKNKILFDPPKKYFTLPYSKYIRPYDIYHEYNIESSNVLFIGDFIIGHPYYEEIVYTYQKLNNENQDFAYLVREEPKSIKPLLDDSILRDLETKDSTSYFRLLSKGDINSKVNIEATVKCGAEFNSAVRIQRFRLSYNKEEVITSSDTLYTQRKCNIGEEYKIKLIMRLSDLSTYAYNDEIFKLSYDGEILRIKTVIEDPNTKMVYLNLKKEGKYIYRQSVNNKKLTVISANENADGMKFIKSENKVNLGESFNLLHKRNLIPNVVTIDSLNKYTLIKYIK